MRDPSTKDGDVYSGGSRGGARGCCPPLFFDHTKARRVEKVFFFETGSPPFYLRVWMTGLPRYLKVGIPQRRGFVQGGIQGRGPGGCPHYFLTRVRPEGRKKFLFLRPGPPLFISGSEWPGYPVIWRSGSSTGVGVIKPLSQRSSCDVLVPKSVMFRVFKNKPLSPA